MNISYEMLENGDFYEVQIDEKGQERARIYRAAKRVIERDGELVVVDHTGAEVADFAGELKGHVFEGGKAELPIGTVAGRVVAMIGDELATWNLWQTFAATIEADPDASREARETARGLADLHYRPLREGVEALAALRRSDVEVRQP